MKTNFTSKLVALMISASLMATSCKNDAVDLGLASPSSANFKEIRAKALEDLLQTKTFKAEDGLSFTSDKGVKVTINPNCLRDQSNNLVTGDVTLSFVEIFDRGNMILTNKPVMGKDGAGNLLPLVTGGQYNISLSKGNQTLKPGCIFTVSVPASNTGALDSEMKLWEGNIDEDGNLAWEEKNRDGAQGKEAGMGANTQTARYDIWDSEFGWANVDRFYNDPRPKTQIKVTVPSGYNNENSGVYLAYEGEPNVLAQLDTYDTQDHYFSEHYGFIPIGMNLHVVFVSESNGSVVYAIKKATIIENGVIVIHTGELQTGSKSSLVGLINALN